MNRIRLTASCPECDEEMKIFLVDAMGNIEPTVDISNFEQATFHCTKCDKDFYTSDIDLLDEDDV